MGGVLAQYCPTNEGIHERLRTGEAISSLLIFLFATKSGDFAEGAYSKRLPRFYDFY
jgi:hypothetical protein